MAQIELSLLGTFNLTVDGAPVSRFRSQREAALLAYLAVEAEQAHARERLAGLLWPDKPETVARQNLRQTLTNLRALLHDDQRQPPLLLAERNTVQWNRNSSYTLDVATFRTALAACAAHNHSDLVACPTCQARLTAAVALYQGPLLDNFAFGDSDLYEEWLLLTREHFQQQAQQTLSHLCDAALAYGDWAKLAQFARRQVAIDPLHEPAQRHLIQALVSQGDRGGALSHFEHFAAYLQRELGVAPSPETLALINQLRHAAPVGQMPQCANGNAPATPKPSHPEAGKNIYKLAEVKLADAPAIAPPPAQPAPASYAAPQPPTPPIASLPIHDWGGMAANSRLVGRAAEEAQLQGWLHSGVQVICLWGWAGVGKTALAQAVARSQSDHCPVIIWRSLLNAPPLAALLRDWLTVLGEPALVDAPTTVDVAIDQLLQRLFEHLRRRRILFVLDNLEALLQRGPAGRFRPEHEAYGHFLQRFAQSAHQGALLLTCREQPELFARLEEETPSLRSLALAGLSQADGQQLLAANGLPLPPIEGAKLVERFTGNPALLNFAANSIQDLFGGDVRAFLAEEALMYGQIRDLFEQYRARMTYIEGAILSWLSVACAPVPLARLRAALVSPIEPEMAEAAVRYSTNGFVEAIHSLQRRGLLEQTPTGFTTVDVVMQNMNSFMLERLAHEVLTGKVGPALYEFALVDAQASAPLRHKQLDGLVRPLVERLAPHFHQDGLVTRLEQMYAAVCQTPLPTRNYLLENLVTLLEYVQPGHAANLAARVAETAAAAVVVQDEEEPQVIPAVLPNQLTPLIGRARELAELVERLHQPNVRLLTLVGAGGMGKTTLALAVAQSILDFGFWILDSAAASLNPKSRPEAVASQARQNPKYTDGIFFVALAPLTSTAALPSTIATTLGLTLQGSDLGQALLQQLRHKQLLLILDNVEHLLHEANGDSNGIRIISEILQAAPGVQMLATSRERLNLRGEHLYPVPPLAFAEQATLAEAAAAPAVQLFVQSAQRSATDFLLTAENLPFVLRICRLVQGIPLGLELAAANVELLPLAEIAGEIERSAEFLAVDWHDLPARQRSMRAVFDWSWRLLNRAEQATLRQLAIFQGGFTREAALQVVGAGLPALTGLMRKSLLHRLDIGGGERFQIHELLRQFAAEQLASEPQVEQAVRRQHAAYYLPWLAAQDADLVGPRSTTAIQAIETELGNINEAWLWAGEAGAVALLDAVLVSLHHFYALKGRAPEGVALFAQAATRLGEPPLDEARTLTLARLRTFQSALLIEMADFDQAHPLLESTLPVLQRLGTRAETAFCLSTMGLLAYRTGSYHEAKAHCQAAIALYNAIGDARGLAFTVNILGHVHGDLGEYGAARQMHEENLARRRANHDRYGTVYSLNNLGAVAARSQAYDEAQRLYEEALTLAQTIDYRPGISLGYLNLGALAYWRGDAATALHLAQQALTVTQAINDHRNLAWALVNRGNAHLGLGNYADAARDLHEAAHLALSLRAVPRTLAALTSIAMLRAKTGDLLQAVELATFCLAHPAAAKETQVAAAKLLDELTPQLPSAALRAAQAQARTKTLEQIVAALP